MSRIMMPHVRHDTAWHINLDSATLAAQATLPLALRLSSMYQVGPYQYCEICQDQESCPRSME